MVQAFVLVGYLCLNLSTATKFNARLPFSDSKERKTLHVALHHRGSYQNVLQVSIPAWLPKTDMHFCQADPRVEVDG